MTYEKIQNGLYGNACSGKSGQDSPFICKYGNGRLTPLPGVIEALKIAGEQKPVICAVGGGGKTSLLKKLAGEYLSRGRKVVVTTTTHMMAEDKPWFLLEPSEEKMRRILENYGQVWIGEPAQDGKMKSVSAGFLKIIWNMHLPVLIEADGARRQPMKVPAEWEPVIPPEATHVLCVYGLDALGRPLERVCFRPETAAEFLDKKITEPVTAEDIAALALSGKAGKKGCPAHAEYTVVLNKAETFERRIYAYDICRTLEETGNGDGNIIVSALACPEDRNREADGK